MKVLIYLIGFSFLFSCKKENKKPILNESVQIDSLTNLTGRLFKNIESFSDTLYFNIENDSIQNDFVIINLVKDSLINEICHKSTFEFNFYRNDKFSMKTNETINCFTEGSAWYFLFGLNENDNSKRYFEIINGYEACGYTQHHFLFYLDNTIAPIFNYETMSDSGWGEYFEFENVENNSFFVKKVSFLPVDYESDEELGIYSISDSIRYFKSKETWLKEELSEKGITIRSKTLSFSEFHGIE